MRFILTLAIITSTYLGLHGTSNAQDCSNVIYGNHNTLSTDILFMQKQNTNNEWLNKCYELIIPHGEITFITVINKNRGVDWDIHLLRTIYDIATEQNINLPNQSVGTYKNSIRENRYIDFLYIPSRSHASRYFLVVRALPDMNTSSLLCIRTYPEYSFIYNLSQRMGSRFLGYLLADGAGIDTGQGDIITDTAINTLANIAIEAMSNEGTPNIARSAFLGYVQARVDQVFGPGIVSATLRAIVSIGYDEVMACRNSVRL